MILSLLILCWRYLVFVAFFTDKSVNDANFHSLYLISSPYFCLVLLFLSITIHWFCSFAVFCSKLHFNFNIYFLWVSQLHPHQKIIPSTVSWTFRTYISILFNRRSSEVTKIENKTRKNKENGLKLWITVSWIMSHWFNRISGYFCLVIAVIYQRLIILNYFFFIIVVCVLYVCMYLLSMSQKYQLNWSLPDKNRKPNSCSECRRRTLFKCRTGER